MLTELGSIWEIYSTNWRTQTNCSFVPQTGEHKTRMTVQNLHLKNVNDAYIISTKNFKLDTNLDI